MKDDEFYTKVRLTMIAHDLVYNDFVNGGEKTHTPFGKEKFNMLQKNAIAIISDMGEVTMNNLAKRLSMLPTNLSPLIKDLETRGFVQRFHKPDFDKRFIFVKMTEKGIELVDRQVEEHAKTLKKALNDALSDEEQDDYLLIYKKLVSYLERMNAVEGFDTDSAFKRLKEDLES